jgi:hypothetical protein
VTINAGWTDNTVSSLAPVNSDTNLLTGSYTKNFNDLITNQTVTNGNPQALDQAVLNLNTSAGQTSLVAGTLFSGSGSAMAGASVVPSLGQWSANTSGQSLYNVDFTVASPTELSLTGDINGSVIYHVGTQELIAANITLSSSASSTPLYSMSFAPNFYSQSETLDDPVSFSTLLEPGQTYTLNAQASAHANKAGIGASYDAPASAAFSFSATVPEPTTMLFAPMAITLLRRRPRKAIPLLPA